MMLLEACLIVLDQVAPAQSDLPYQLKDPIQGAPLVVTAYALFWAIAVAFLIVLYRRQSRLDLELRALAEQLKRRDAESRSEARR